STRSRTIWRRRCSRRSNSSARRPGRRGRWRWRSSKSGGRPRRRRSWGRICSARRCGRATGKGGGVALSFLGKWFGGRRPTDPALDEVRAELDRLAGERPAFAAPLRWLRELLPDLTPDPEPPSLTLTAADA